MPQARETLTVNKRTYICDFSRGGLNTRSIRSYPNLAPRPQIRIISFSEGCALAVEVKSEFIWERFEGGFRSLWLFEGLKIWKVDTYLTILNYLTL